jgi:signal transduction histidine kinase
LTDGALFVVAAGLPPVTLLAAAEDGSTPVGPAFGATMVVLSVLHALPLLWRRRAPLPVLWAVAATAWLWPLARDVGLLPSVWMAYLHFAALAEVFAVYALAVYGRGVRTWPAILVAACGLAGALAATGAVDGSLSGEDASVAAVSEAVVVLTIMGGVVLTLVWVAGLAVRRRRLRVVLREEEEITGSEQEAADAVAAERRRIANGLQEAVLHRTAAVSELAGRGELDAVAAAARSALEAMRELLHRLRETAPEDGQPRRPGDPDRADTLRVSGPTAFRGELSGGGPEQG